MNTQENWSKALSQKMSYYKAVGKQCLTNKTLVSTALAVTVLAVAPEALANGVTEELNFKSLADEGLDSMKNGAKSAFAVLGVGITVAGGFKGYSLLKGGMRRA